MSFKQMISPSSIDLDLLSRTKALFEVTGQGWRVSLTVDAASVCSLLQLQLLLTCRGDGKKAGAKCFCFIHSSWHTLKPLTWKHYSVLNGQV